MNLLLQESQNYQVNDSVSQTNKKTEFARRSCFLFDIGCLFFKIAELLQDMLTVVQKKGESKKVFSVCIQLKKPEWQTGTSQSSLTKVRGL